MTLGDATTQSSQVQSALRGAPRETALLHFLLLDATPRPLTLTRIGTSAAGALDPKPYRASVPDSGAARAEMADSQGCMIQISPQHGFSIPCSCQSSTRLHGKRRG